MVGLSFLGGYQALIPLLIDPKNSELVTKVASSFSLLEYESSKWIVNQLQLTKCRHENVAIAGCSFGTYLVPMLCTRLSGVRRIVMYDRDARKLELATVMHQSITDVNISYVCQDLHDSNPIYQSSFDVVVVPYADRIPDMVNIRSSANKATYVFQSAVTNQIGSAEALVNASGCIQYSYRDVATIGNTTRAMVIGSKRI